MENKQTIFRVNEGGPLEVSGSFRIKGPNGEVFEKEGPVFLCRCGHSSNKPFCDESHKLNGFSE